MLGIKWRLTTDDSKGRAAIVRVHRNLGPQYDHPGSLRVEYDGGCHVTAYTKGATPSGDAWIAVLSSDPTRFGTVVDGTAVSNMITAQLDDADLISAVAQAMYCGAPIDSPPDYVPVTDALHGTLHAAVVRCCQCQPCLDILNAVGKGCDHEDGHHGHGRGRSLALPLGALLNNMRDPGGPSQKGETNGAGGFGFAVPKPQESGGEPNEG